MQQLLGPSVRLYGGKLNMEVEASAMLAGPNGTRIEQFYPPHQRHDVLATGIYLEEDARSCDLDNGLLMVMAGHASRPDLGTITPTAACCGAMDPAACDLDVSEAVPLMGPAGSMTTSIPRTAGARLGAQPLQSPAPALCCIE